MKSGRRNRGGNRRIWATMVAATLVGVLLGVSPGGQANAVPDGAEEGTSEPSIGSQDSNQTESTQTSPITIQAAEDTVPQGNAISWKAQLKASDQPTIIYLPGVSDSELVSQQDADTSSPTVSAFTGSYTLTRVALSGDADETSTTLTCTTVEEPSFDMDESQWSTDCGQDTTAIKVDPAEDQELTIELSPTDNTAGDEYVAWTESQAGQVGSSTVTISESDEASEEPINTEEDQAEAPKPATLSARAPGIPSADVMKSAAKVDCPTGSTTCDVSWNVTIRNQAVNGSQIASEGAVDFTGASFTDSTSEEVYDIQAYIGEPVKQVSSGYAHSLALTESGYVYAWGRNDTGQLGNKDTNDSNVPVRVVTGAQKDPSGSLSRVVYVSAGWYHSMAVTDSGDVYTWGYNAYGQLGNNQTTESLTPVQVRAGAQKGSSYLSDVEIVSARGDYSLAVTSAGEVYAWGHNRYGQLGSPTVPTGTVSSALKKIPVQVVAGEQDSAPGAKLADVVQVSGTSSHVLAVTRSGEVYAWGQNNKGQLGSSGFFGALSATPLQVAAGEQSSISGAKLSDVVQVSAGVGFSLAVTEEGKVYAWGDNMKSQLGIGANNASPIRPVQVVSGEQNDPSQFLSEIIGISASNSFSLAYTSKGEVFAWGENKIGQLGNNNLAVQETGFPVKVTAGAQQNGSAFLSGVTQVSAGYEHSLALDLSGEVYAWGRNNNGQLGNGADGPAASSAAPVVTEAEWWKATVKPLTMKSEAPSGAFVERAYSSDDADPSKGNGNEWLDVQAAHAVVVRVTGKVDQQANGFVVGNQAWFSSDQTPRSAPDLSEPLPAFDPLSPWAFGKWVGNASCSATQGWEVPGDACDQVFASVEGLPAALVGEIKGSVWDDTLGNGYPTVSSGVAVRRSRFCSVVYVRAFALVLVA